MDRLHTIAVRAACFLIATATSVGAQTHPDFSGVWQRVDAADARPSVAATGDAGFRQGDMGSGWGSPITIARSGDSLIVEFPYFSAYDLQPPIRYAYAMNGGDSRNVVMIGHSPSEQHSRIAWRGDTLDITTRIPVPAGVDLPGMAAEVRQSLVLASATSLTIVTTRAGVQGPPVNVVRTTYTKR